MKKFILTYEFLVGELGNISVLGIEARSETAAWSKADKYFKHFYGPGQLVDRDGYFFLYSNGAGVKLRGMKRITDLESLWSETLPIK